MVVLGNFDSGMSFLYYQQSIQPLNVDGTATNGIIAKDQWMVLELPLKIKFTDTYVK